MLDLVNLKVEESKIRFEQFNMKLEASEAAELDELAKAWTPADRPQLTRQEALRTCFRLIRDDFKRQLATNNGESKATATEPAGEQQTPPPGEDGEQGQHTETRPRKGKAGKKAAT